MTLLFDFPLFAKLVAGAFRPPPDVRGIGAVLHPFRVLCSLLGYLLLESFNGVCLLLDEVLFPGYRRVEVRAPIFIIGNPRSGTTFLHRTLSRDSERFLVFKTWELLFPSILQKKIGSWLGRFDRRMGSSLRRIIEHRENQMLGSFQEMHPTGLFVPEEDEILFLHPFASIFLIFFFRSHAAARVYLDFDRDIAPERRERLLLYYRRCLQRQAYARGVNMVFLSKNPMFGGKIASLHRHFPDARFVYLVRNPMDAVPSMLSEGHASCVYAKVGTLPTEDFQEQVFQAARVLYRRPLEYLDAHPEAGYQILKFAQLVKHPLATVSGLYARWGFDLTPAFRQTLEEEDAKSARYRSAHQYAIEQFSIDADRIAREFSDVMARFGFVRPAPASPDKEGNKPVQ